MKVRRILISSLLLGLVIVAGLTTWYLYDSNQKTMIADENLILTEQTAFHSIKQLSNESLEHFINNNYSDALLCNYQAISLLNYYVEHYLDNSNSDYRDASYDVVMDRLDNAEKMVYLLSDFQDVLLRYSPDNALSYEEVSL